MYRYIDIDTHTQKAKWDIKLWMWIFCRMWAANGFGRIDAACGVQQLYKIIVEKVVFFFLKYMIRV